VAWSAGVLDPAKIKTLRPVIAWPGSTPPADVSDVATAARDEGEWVGAESSAVMVVSSGIIPTAPPTVTKSEPAATELNADGVTRYRLARVVAWAPPADSVADNSERTSPRRPAIWAYPNPECVTVKESNTLNTSRGLLELVPVLIRVAFCNGPTVDPE
jgi:hypothetical protein